MPVSTRARLRHLLALTSVIAVTLAVWRFSATSRHPDLPSLRPDDDLPPLAGSHDVALGLAAPRDVLVVGPDELYLARANDRTIVAFPKSAGQGRVLARVEGAIGGMAIGDGALWWTIVPDAPAGARRGTLMKVGLRGGAPTVVADGFAAPHAVASDGHWVFVVDVDASVPGLLPQSSIVRVSAHEQQRTVVARCNGRVADVALDGEYAYWADRLEGTIVAAPKSGGDPHVLASGRGLPGEVVVDEMAVYWVEDQSESLWRMPKSGGAPRSIAQDLAGFVSVAADAHALWWVNAAAVDGVFSVLTVRKTGGEPAIAAAVSDAIGALGSDGTRIFWEHAGGLSVIP